MATVRRWTGREAKHLRTALRLDQRDFAAHLGVGVRTINKWEARGGGVTQQPYMQAILDTALQRASEDERARFSAAAADCPTDGQEPPASQDVRPGALLPVIVNGRPVYVPLDVTSSTANDISALLGVPAQPAGESERPRAVQEPVSPLDRRSLLTHGLAVTALQMLGLDDAAFVPPRLALSPPPPISWAVPIYDAVVNPLNAARGASSAWGTDSMKRPDDESVLREGVDKATRVSLSADYTQLARLLPSLIGYAESIYVQANGGSQVTVLCLLSDVYAAAGWALIKADHPVGAWLAAQRAVQAAQQADDALRLAAATRCLAEVHMRAHNFEEATRTAFLAAVHLDTAQPANRRSALCLRGAALLSASAAAARRGDSHEAYASLQAATTCATELNEERSDLGTVFGPPNVAIHRVAVAVELGDARGAASHLPTVRLDRCRQHYCNRASGPFSHRRFSHSRATER